MLKTLKQTSSSHKVTIKVVSQYYGPADAINYLYGKGLTEMVIIKHRTKSITFTFNCPKDIYNSIKFDFIRNKGNIYIWRD